MARQDANGNDQVALVDSAGNPLKVSPANPNAGGLAPTGVPVISPTVWDIGDGVLYQPLSAKATADGDAGKRFAGAPVYLWNGATFDRMRGNTDITVLGSAARVSSGNSSDLTNYNGKGLHLVIDVTSITATPSITVTIQGKDATSGKYYTILASPAITGVGTTVLKVGPGLTAAANAVANDILPRTWRVSVAHGNGDSITYSIGASIIL